MVAPLCKERVPCAYGCKARVYDDTTRQRHLAVCPYAPNGPSSTPDQREKPVVKSRGGEKGIMLRDRIKPLFRGRLAVAKDHESHHYACR
ncbi:hypothetical protein BOTBODRAFT_34034 [Botryobasidium botryosum FD-172 SS1]|uniref:Uncharacterized protein n=1 Tax=Botryobasidium botryosum (strain FD-172 SS1) TaxID=930990 RepID=A0A067MMV4_BOTB1|nr:hypothetical protein BOTBODRAFT_34034 [Botryobasidium botryosum FD-172 SS1]